MTVCSLFGRALLGATALATIATSAAAQRVDSITAFGDSYADTGNLFEILGFNPAPLVYPTGRFSGGTNYIDTLSQLLNVPVDNFAIGGALTNNTNTNGVGLPGFVTEWNAFLAGGGGPFPAVSGTFDSSDLVTFSVGGNDARFYQQQGGTLAGAPAAATASAAFATAGLNALVDAGAQNISFLAGNTAILPEIANDPAAQAIRQSYSTTFNTQMQGVLAGYAADGVIVHYLDLTAIGQQIVANPGAYGLQSAGACAPAPACIADSNLTNQFLFYVDNLHLTSAGFAIVGRYIAAQLQAPLTLEAPSEAGMETARQFGRTLSSRVDLTAPRDGDVAEGLKLFIVGDTYSRDVKADAATDGFDIDGVGGTVGASYGFGNGTVGIAANYTRPRVRFGNDASRNDVDTWQIGGFGGFSIAGGFVQGYLGYGQDNNDIERAGVVNNLNSSPDGDHWLAGAKAGYLFPLGTMRAGPVVALDYAKAKVDGYTEEGDAALSLNVGKTSAKSFTAGIGAEIRGDFESGGSSIRPFASAMLEKELSDDGRSVQFAQTSAPGIVNTWAFEDRSTKAYGRVSFGGSAGLFSNVTINAIGSATLGRDQGNDVSAQVGLHAGF
ncbi:autotransporter domain-containing protein [Sphingomonas sp. SM33]|uniref:Autotransporter domain-containing protein n=1 Tax=Sphingomonas telluris TaxID=2907998 RepID=A0ABS9VQI6_9SPHN|nr:autotransporter domain-containing protein [Sphingomonas telluris]MCH8617251.1 autotransporter domain-containing protein [Sphingomonas telluris]